MIEKKIAKKETVRRKPDVLVASEILVELREYNMQSLGDAHVERRLYDALLALGLTSYDLGGRP